MIGGVTCRSCRGRCTEKFLPSLLVFALFLFSLFRGQSTLLLHSQLFLLVVSFIVVRRVVLAFGLRCRSFPREQAGWGLKFVGFRDNSAGLEEVVGFGGFAFGFLPKLAVEFRLLCAALGFRYLGWDGLL